MSVGIPCICEDVVLASKLPQALKASLCSELDTLINQHFNLKTLYLYCADLN